MHEKFKSTHLSEIAWIEKIELDSQEKAKELTLIHKGKVIPHKVK